MAPLVPKLKVPFSFTSGKAATVEQDSTDEIIQCCQAVLLTPVDSRIELPEFGTPDQTFASPHADPTEVRRALDRWEPRAQAIVTESPDAYDAMIDNVRVLIHEGGAS